MGKKPKILYVAAGNPVTPRTGMDVVIGEHIHELTACDAFDLTGVFVAPGTVGRDEKCAAIPWKNFTGFIGDMRKDKNPFYRALKKSAHLLTGGLLCHYSFLSDEASRYIRRQLAEGCDAVIIDHFLACAVIKPWRLGKNTRLIFIAHDVTPHAILDTGRLKKSPLAQIYFKIQALQTWIMEILLIRKSTATVFLSAWDRRYYQWLGADKLFSLCPLLRAAPTASQAAPMAYEKRVIFVGAPNFPPNKFALDWIIEKLAPELYILNPQIIMTLIGKDTDRLAGVNTGNIEALGFVPDAHLSSLMKHCLCAISPVIHGSGIKIKVLEAFAAGCPVFATAESLRGYEFMGIAPQIDIDNPKATAEKLAALASHQAAQISQRAFIKKTWTAYCAAHAGSLNRLVKDIVT